MTRKRTRPARCPPCVATPWPGLVGAPFALLLNLLVCTQEDNVKTDGPIPPDAIGAIQALIRQRYNFPDLMLDQEKGVAISLIGQFFHVDDYRELSIAHQHRDRLLAGLKDLAKGAEPRPFDMEGGPLRQSKVVDPQSLVAGQEQRFAFWYKQRLLAFYFVGERAQIERLTREPPGESLLDHIVAVLVQALGLSEQMAVFIHPELVPAARMPEVSLQNAMEWAQAMKERLDAGKIGALAVVGPPGPSYIVRRRGE